MDPVALTSGMRNGLLAAIGFVAAATLLVLAALPNRQEGGSQARSPSGGSLAPHSSRHLMGAAKTKVYATQ